MIYVCENCHFLFKDGKEADRCPDCGKRNIRPATADEQQEFCASLGALPTAERLIHESRW
jgi:rRNA maturation endonuclease Nob1